MWFRQIQLFRLNSARSLIENLVTKLEPLAFTPCLPSCQQSLGWVSPIDEEDGQFVRSISDKTMLCLQVEEKILPASVVQQELRKTVRKLETVEERKLRQKEKDTLKDEIVLTLLPRAFSKLTKIYAYIDAQKHWLVLGTINIKKTEQFISLFKKMVTQDIEAVKIDKLSFTMTHWLKNQDYPSSFSIEKACLLQDPSQKTRIVQCKQQNLFATSIQSLLKDGCEAIRLALCWQDKVNFVLSSDFSLTNIQFQEEVLVQADEMEPETKRQQFDADFLIMTAILSPLLSELQQMLSKTQETA